MANDSMRAIRIHQYGGPDQLRLEQVPRPPPTGGEVLVRVKSAGVDPVDWKIRSGFLKDWRPVSFPWIPGGEGAGVVEEVGPDGKGFKRGQEVFGCFGGSYAEYATAAPGDIAEKPRNLSFDEAAAVPIGALTAWNVVIETAGLEPGMRMLVLGAAGGVGHFAVQLARWKKARVIGTCSRGNMEFVRTLGAEQVIDYAAGPLGERAEAKNVDVVVDTVGGDTAVQALATLKAGGLLVTVAGPAPEEQAKSLGARAVAGHRASAERLGELRELLRSRIIVPVVHQVYGLADARKAQEQSETRHGRGRIVLHIAD
jgi:NADPH:quinone reductase-like Zn-dependent oxidoreductase